ncbi:MAG: hypothetical protein M1495_18645 [Bacteroidetes bacterium]|nr:hypothetical protein [Bacteroidota bacterium]
MAKETKLPKIDPVTSVLFDLEFRLITVQDNLKTAERLLNQARELRKTRPLNQDDFSELDSLLITAKEFFDVVPDDLMSELYQAIRNEKDAQNDSN